jgi:hypothetical protein
MYNNLSSAVTRAMLDELRRTANGPDRLHSLELRRQRRLRGRRRRET